MAASDQVRALRWDGAALHVLDQRLLPAEEQWLIARDAAETARVIHDMAVRGPPAVGGGGAVGVCEVVDHAEGAGTRGKPPAGVGFQIPIEVVSDVRFGIVVGKRPGAAAVGIVVGGGEAVGGIVTEAILLLG